MAELAIRGHESRGKEVIEILEMLGGNVDKKILSAANIGDILNPHVYFFDTDSSNNRIVWYYLLGLESDGRASEMMIFTLEEFEEKYPYKVGDKVCYQPNSQIDTICISEIISMKWADNNVIYFTNNGHSLYACDLRPYKEETMEKDTNKAIFEGNAQSCDIMNDIIKEETMKEKGDKAKAPNLVGEDYSGKRFGYKIPQGYEIDCIQNNEIIIKPIKPQYPKIYKECCEVVNASPYVALVYDIFNGQTYSHDIDNLQIYENLRKLKICRDAYWKIAGDWEEKRKERTIHYLTYSTLLGEVVKCSMPNCIANYLLDFPTEEMRDEFYNNFKDLIEQCKELL